jgi:biotin carboxyl carrier protein
MTDWRKLRLLEARLRLEWRPKYAYRHARVILLKAKGDNAHHWLDQHRKKHEAKAAAANERQIEQLRPQIVKWQALVGEAAREMRALEAAIAKLRPKPPPGRMVNPFHRVRGLSPAGLDKGVDYSGSGTIVALADGHVYYATQSSTWPGGAFVGFTIEDGQYKGKHVYHAENLTILVREGDHVKVDQPIAILHNAYPYSESGWAAGYGENTLAGLLGQPRNSAAGASFNRLLRRLGAPSGGGEGAAEGQMPAGFP